MTIEVDVIAWLGLSLDVPVYGGVPRERPASFVSVERTGGAIDTHRDLPTFAVQSWAPTTASAAALADQVRTVLPSLTDLAQVARVDIGSTYNWPDPDSKTARYQTIVSLTVKWEPEKGIGRK